MTYAAMDADTDLAGRRSSPWDEFVADVTSEMEGRYGVGYREVQETADVGFSRIARAFRVGADPREFGRMLGERADFLARQEEGPFAYLAEVRQVNLERMRRIRELSEAQPRIRPYKEWGVAPLHAEAPTHDPVLVGPRASYIKAVSDAMRRMFHVNFSEVFKYIDPGLTRLNEAMRRKVSPLDFVRAIGERLGLVSARDGLSPEGIRDVNLRLIETAGRAPAPLLDEARPFMR